MKNRNVIFAVVLSAFSATWLLAREKQPTVLDYYVAIKGPVDESGEPHKFAVKDIANGYLKDDNFEVALFYKSDRTPIMVLSNQYSDAPQLMAYELIDGKWSDQTARLLPPQINETGYICKRFVANGVPLTPEIYDQYASKPIMAQLPRKGKTITFLGPDRISENETEYSVILFKVVFESDQFKLLEK